MDGVRLTSHGREDWKLTEDQTLKQQQGNPKPDNGLYSPIPLVDSFRSSGYKDWSKEDLTNVIHRNWVDALEIKVGEMYNG